MRVVAQNSKKAGRRQFRAFLVAGVAEILHGEEIGGVFGGQPEGITPPGSVARESARCLLQLGKPGGVDIVKPVEEYAAHGGFEVSRVDAGRRRQRVSF